jgi:glycolate oxidase FAD binding subunit
MAGKRPKRNTLPRASDRPESVIIEGSMETFRPETPEQLADALRAAASANQTIRLGGNFSKDRLGGSPEPAQISVSTSSLTRLLQYDPRDLTLSVQAGMPFAELERTLAQHRQMLPLDPALSWSSGATQSTVGGVVAANLSGPRRRLYGTARDMIIGMTFATLEGKLVSSGGMVVKNVAGLDMAKLMIGSFGTLAAIATVNFKVFPIPTHTRTFVMQFPAAAAAFAERDRILSGVLQPTAIDIVNWPSGFRLLVQAGGNESVLTRYARELPSAQPCSESVWEEIREFTPAFLAEHPRGFVQAIPVKLTEMPAVVQQLSAKLNVPIIARAGSGVVYAHYAADAPAVELGETRTSARIKAMFDPEGLLNRGRLYGHI